MCLPCLKNCISCSNGTSCLLCTDSKYLLKPDLGECTECTDSNQIKIEKRYCKICDVNCVKCKSESVCEKCKEDCFLDEQGECFVCKSYCAECKRMDCLFFFIGESKTKCKVCQEYYYLKDEECNKCESCYYNKLIL